MTCFSGQPLSRRARAHHPAYRLDRRTALEIASGSLLQSRASRRRRGRGTARRARRTPRPPRPSRGGRAAPGGRPASGRSDRPAGSESGSPRPKRPRHWTVQGPISRDREQARVGGRARPESQRPAAISRATAAQGDRALRREAHRLEFGRRPTGDQLGGRDVAQLASRPRPSRSAPAADDPALDPRRAAGLDQLLDDRPGERLPGPGPAARAQVRAGGGSAGRAAGRGGSGGRTRRGRRRRRARSASARSPAPAAAAGRRRCAERRRRRCDRRRVERLGPQRDPLRARLPGPDQDRAALDVEQAGGDAAADPHHAVLAAVAGQADGRGRLDLQLSSGAGPPHGAQRPRRWTSTRKERLARTFVGALACAREPPRRALARADGAPTARTAATVAAPASDARRRRRSPRSAPRCAGPARRGSR